MTSALGQAKRAYTEVPAKHEARVYVVLARADGALPALRGTRLGREASPPATSWSCRPRASGCSSRPTCSATAAGTCEPTAARSSARRPSRGRSPSSSRRSWLATGIYAGIQVRKALPRDDARRAAASPTASSTASTSRKAGRSSRSGTMPARNCFWVPIRKIESRPYEGWVYNLEMASAPNAYTARGFAVHNCTAPIYATDSLHVAVVEVIALPRSKVRYTTIQNWSNDVYNLVTKRAHAYENATVEWIDANTGSRKTVKYPSIYLRGRGRQRGHHLRRRGRQGPAPGHRRQGDPPGAGHQEPHRLQVRLQGRRPRHVPRPRQGRAGCHQRRRERPLRRADARRPEPQRHVPLHRHPGRRHDADP